ncbi:hypothetical protein Ae406Ps2_6480c [Pseudonocardia sp. Ae406_Ps2]|nr:hypothetical protein Ae406Ps2_6480c [Pseudonocardia sp. Ae406_Ps2]OLL89785.1 hypothetical protein Ae331Ps2_6121c [Pseudonocardia sp. Ae331_Ps2]
MGGRSSPPDQCLISDADIAFIVTTATTRPDKLDLPFTRWSIRKLAAHLGPLPRAQDCDQP